MTLQEWSDQSGNPINHHRTTGAVYVLIDIVRQRKWAIEVFHLSDYVVSTVGGMTHWLSPRKGV